MNPATSRCRSMCLAVVCISVTCALSPTAAPGKVFHDRFDDSLLDPAWSVTLNDYATGWDYTECGTTLAVYDIGITGYSSSISGSPWAVVTLQQPIAPMNDFRFFFDFSWDSEGSVQAMQVLELALLAGDDSVVARCQYGDWWVGGPAVTVVGIGGDRLQGNSLLPLAGSAATELVRTGEDVVVYWDGEPLHSGKIDSPVETVQLTFRRCTYSGSMGTSYLGTLAVDRTSTIPEPATLALLVLGGLGVLLRRRR